MSKTPCGTLARRDFHGWLAASRCATCAETLVDALALAYDSQSEPAGAAPARAALDETYVQARAGFRPTLSLQGEGSYLQTRTPHAAGGGLIDTNGDGIPDAVGKGITECSSPSSG